MIDIDFGPIALAIFILYTIVFLIGFTIVLFPSMFLYRTLKKRPLWSHRPLFVFTLLASVLGGFLAHQFLLIWDRAEEDASWAQYQAFGKKMEHDYPLEIQYHPDLPYDQQFELVFSVPATGIYDLHVFGFLEGESEDYADLRNAVIELHNYGLPFETGTNEFTFGFVDDNVPIRTDQNIYFIVVIQPKVPREKLINTQEGIAVTNPGSVLLTDGVNYYSSEFFASSGCLNNIYQWVPCLKHDHLQIRLFK